MFKKQLQQVLLLSLQGVCFFRFSIQGDALGYEKIAPSGRKLL